LSSYHKPRCHHYITRQSTSSARHSTGSFMLSDPTSRRGTGTNFGRCKCCQVSNMHLVVNNKITNKSTIAHCITINNKQQCATLNDFPEVVQGREDCGCANSAPIPAPTAPVPAPTAPIPAPTAPIPAPTAPVPAPTAPVPAPTAPVPAPTAPVPVPAPQPVPQPTPVRYSFALV